MKSNSAVSLVLLMFFLLVPSMVLILGEIQWTPVTGVVLALDAFGLVCLFYSKWNQIIKGRWEAFGPDAASAKKKKVYIMGYVALCIGALITFIYAWMG